MRVMRVCNARRPTIPSARVVLRGYRRLNANLKQKPQPAGSLTGAKSLFASPLGARIFRPNTLGKSIAGRPATSVSLHRLHVDGESVRCG